MPQSDSRYPLDFYLALAANLFFFTSFQWTFATLPAHLQEIGGGAAAIGLAFGLFSLSAVLSRPIVGWLVDHWGRKPVLLLGASFAALALALYAPTRSLWLFQAERVLHGLGMAAFTTAYTTLIGDLAPPARRGEAIGLSGVTNNLGMIVAPALGLTVAAAWGYAVHFWLSASIAVLSPLLLLLITEPARGSDAGHAEQPDNLWAVARLRPVWVSSLGITALAVSLGAVLSFLAPFVAERDLTASGAYFSVMALTMILTQSGAGWLSDRVGRRAVAVPGLAIAALSMAGLAMVRSDAALVAAGAVFGLAWGLSRAGIDTSVVEAVPAQARGMAVGVLYTCFDTGVGVASFGLGIVAQSRGYAAAFYAAAAWAVLALTGYALWGRKRT